MNFSIKGMLFLLGLFALSPARVHAHTVGGSLNGWHDGFNHPLHGWDHLLAMLAVGIWAAQQRGRAQWLLPLAFVGAMSVGGIGGAAGIGRPGVELAISLSVVVFVAKSITMTCPASAARIRATGLPPSAVRS